MEPKSQYGNRIFAKNINFCFEKILSFIKFNI